MPRRSSFRARSPRRKTGWEAGFLTAAFNVAAAGKTLMEGFTYVDGVLDEGTTLIRMHGHLATFSDGGAADEGWNYAWGIGILPATTVAAGAASLPGPLSEMNWEGWIWHYTASVITSDAAVPPSGSANGITSNLIKIDSKARRHFDANEESFFLIFESGTETGTIIQRMRAVTRHLYMLP